MKHLSIIYVSLCLALTMGSCEHSEKIAEPSFNLTAQELTFIGYKSTLTVKVEATRRWSTVVSEYWISVTPNHYPGADESFIANVAVTVPDNTTGQVREGYITFFLQDEEVATLHIRQDIPDEEEKPEEEFPVTWANLQWKSSDSLKEGEVFEAGSCVFADGITNAMDSETGENITCEIGYSLEDTSPESDGWTWASCWFNGDWGDNFYYQGRIENLVAGTYYYSFRIRNGDGPYKYAGTNGLWDGEENRNGSFQVTHDKMPPAEYKK